MNILYILGNGFDKAMGMATSYPEFYKYLKENIKNGSSLFNKMMSHIGGKELDQIFLRKKLFIIQHLYNPEIVYPTQMQNRCRLERTQQNIILDKFNISEENRTPELRNRLYFTINENIFKV